MMWSLTALLIISSLQALAQAQTAPAPICCQKKTVTGTPDLDGVYTFKKEFEAGQKDENCEDGCIYTRDGREEEYCFKATQQGADIAEECEAVTDGPASNSPGDTEAPTQPQSAQPTQPQSAQPTQPQSAQPTQPQ